MCKASALSMVLWLGPGLSRKMKCAQEDSLHETCSLLAREQVQSLTLPGRHTGDRERWDPRARVQGWIRVVCLVTETG